MLLALSYCIVRGRSNLIGVASMRVIQMERPRTASATPRFPFQATVRFFSSIFASGPTESAVRLRHERAT
jgi:hypothetical protein